jgi:hypothetical protein
MIVKRRMRSHLGLNIVQYYQIRNNYNNNNNNMVQM